MTQVFDDQGKVTPVTLVEAGPCVVTEVKKSESHGYDAVQIGFEKLKGNKVKKTNSKKPFRYIKEFRQGAGELKEGDSVDVSIFAEGDKIKVSGQSKGKGFAGAVKRWHFAGGPATHGSNHHRGLGSTGSRYPQHTVKGRKMPGHMGAERKTIKNLKIIKVDKENNLLAISGALPGPRGIILEIREQV